MDARVFIAFSLVLDKNSSLDFIHQVPPSPQPLFFPSASYLTLAPLPAPLSKHFSLAINGEVNYN